MFVQKLTETYKAELNVNTNYTGNLNKQHQNICFFSNTCVFNLCYMYTLAINIEPNIYNQFQSQLLYRVLSTVIYMV